MTVVDSSVLIDYLRGVPSAVVGLDAAAAAGPVHASEVSRLEVLAGMRPKEERATRSLFSAFAWHALDEAVAEQAGAFGRQWLPSHGNIDAADLAIAATAHVLGLPLMTRNVKHFPMFPGLVAPY